MKYWAVSAGLFAVDIIFSWFAFFIILLPYLKESNSLIDNPTLLLIFICLQALWTVLFYLNNCYRADPTLSRFTELQVIFNIVGFVTLIAVVYNELKGMPGNIPTRLLLEYGFILFSLLSVGRLIVRQSQKYFLKRGYGVMNTLIIGVTPRGEQLARYLMSRPSGYRVVGFISTDSPSNRASMTPPGKKIEGVPVIGYLPKLQDAINEYRISEVILAIDPKDHENLLNIISLSNGSFVSLKIIPDMYEVISGLAKTEQIYGLPLIQINPEIMTRSHRILKRLVDIVIATLVLVPFLPIWILVAVAIKLNSQGPVFYHQERVGLGGRRFKIIKFRSMIHGAESETGPTWAEEEDPRITRVGKFLRRFRLDEFPQFLNVLIGDMSVVGPRPERPYFVQKLMEEFPFYYRRHKIRPGITGWAQVKHSYDSSLEDVRQKLKYDFFYIENVSLSLDFKILIGTLFVMLSGRGQ